VAVELTLLIFDRQKTVEALESVTTPFEEQNLKGRHSLKQKTASVLFRVEASDETPRGWTNTNRSVWKVIRFMQIRRTVAISIPYSDAYFFTQI
jgi:hypothetical protein